MFFGLYFQEAFFEAEEADFLVADNWSYAP